jgi:hypothetical protein
MVKNAEFHEGVSVRIAIEEDKKHYFKDNLEAGFLLEVCRAFAQPHNPQALRLATDPRICP